MNLLTVFIKNKKNERKRGKNMAKTQLEKKAFTWNGDKYYLLGKNEQGEQMFLQRATFDCDWYWGVGYVNTFTNNKNPEISRDISSHQHFSYLFGRNSNFKDGFNSIIKESPLTDKELWELCELMKIAYVAKEAMEMAYRGGANYTSSTVIESVKSPTVYNHYDAVIREVNEALDKLLSPSKE